VTIFLIVLHVLACLFLIVIVLLQRGKGAEMGAVFGGGAGATVFGSRGAGNFLTRMTTAAAVVFMVTSLTLAYIARDETGDTLFDEEAPAAADPTFGEPPPAAGEAPGAFEEVPAPSTPEPPAAAPAEPAPSPEPAP
jgi:preprotein translocase subunit SecG